MSLRAQARKSRAAAVLFAVLAAAGCGYSTRPGLPAHLKTVHIVPFDNRIDITRLPTNDFRFPVYRHNMEGEITNSVIERFQFTGLMRPVQKGQADARLEGALLEFRRDALSYDASQNVEQWRLNLIVHVRLTDLTKNTVLWDEPRLVGDTTYYTVGPDAESEDAALDRAIEDLARRIVERSVEDW